MRRLFGAMALLAIFACGCSDDSAKEISVDDGKGDVKNDVGGDCSTSEDCVDGLECRDNLCQDPVAKPEPPIEDGECDSKRKCSIDKVCVDKKCLKKAAMGESCDAASHCMTGECIEGMCGVWGELGATCGEGVICRDGAICAPDLSMCLKYVGEGESCGLYYECNDGLTCNGDDICAQLVDLGQACDSSQYICRGGICDGGICKMYSNGETCDATHICPLQGDICFSGLCIAKAECQSDSQCQADTYCCTEESCETKNVCIPYGMGPRLNMNDACVYQTEPGLFEADLQCDWTGPETGDPYPKSKSVVTPVLVAKTPHNPKSTSNTLIFTSFISGIWQPVDEAYQFGVIRLVDPESCKVIENIYDDNHYVTAGVALAVGVVDDTGYVSIFAQRSPHQPKIDSSTNTGDGGGIVKFKWNPELKKYVADWYITGKAAIDGTKLHTTQFSWGGLALHDVNDDGIAELLTPAGEVLDARTGKKLNGLQYLPLDGRSKFPTVGDIDKDGKIEWISEGGKSNVYVDYHGKSVEVGYGPNVYEWTVERDDKGAITAQYWAPEYTREGSQSDKAVLHAFADIGTVGATPEAFDWNNTDGIAEFVSTSGIEAGRGAASLSIFALAQSTDKDGKTTKSVQRVMHIPNLYGGGAPTIGDFDGDTLPEIGVAFGDYYRVIDPRCQPNADNQLPKECAKQNYLWEMKNQDDSSFTTGSAVFDFDGDGQIEVVYADECYTRIYDGKTGEVLFSSKQSSRTAYEMPTIADVDNDGSAEIVVPANAMQRGCSQYDKTHRGIRCKYHSDCTSNRCENNFCVCESDAECNWRKNADGTVKDEYGCMRQIDGDESSPKVCRAIRKMGSEAEVLAGVRVMRDRYDRWVAARNIWNQFPYSITNIKDDMTIPKATQWVQNFLTKGLNNYRANAQGAQGANVAPDITGKLDKENVCAQYGQEIVLNGVVCNRGTKTVGAKMPASFYKVNEDGSLGEKYCTAYTSENVPTGGCLAVSCSLPADDIAIGLRIRMKTNDDGEGGRTTVECNSDNNDDEIQLTSCVVN